MKQLEKLYQTIQNLKELGFTVSKELLEDANRVEEEIIKNEIIPALAATINPVISQIQREIILIVEYIPNEPEPLIWKFMNAPLRDKEYNRAIELMVPATV